MRISITFTKCKWDITLADRAVAILEKSLGIRIEKLLVSGNMKLWEDNLNHMIDSLDTYDPTWSLDYYKLAMVLEVFKQLSEEDRNRGRGAIGTKRKFGTERNTNTRVDKKRKLRALPAPSVD